MVGIGLISYLAFGGSHVKDRLAPKAFQPGEGTSLQEYLFVLGCLFYSGEEMGFAVGIVGLGPPISQCCVSLDFGSLG